jgi:NAD+ kinase
VIEDGAELTLRKADFHAQLIKLEDQSFFNTMRNKLLWGLDKRN